MFIKVEPGYENKKNILTLLEEMGYQLPCNCHGAHHCNGKRYSFDCAMIPHKPVTVSLSAQTDDIRGIALEDMSLQKESGDTLLIDLGTTTIALILMNKKTGALCQKTVFANPGKKYGADVISRIHASMQGSRELLQKELLDSLLQHTQILCQKNHQTSSELSHCLIAGNTTMIHNLMGYDCTPLSHSPFHIAEKNSTKFAYKSCTVQIFPWISAFIGGDITAGLFACDMLTPVSKTCLFIDLGTNGEMVLSHDNKLYAAATAAGPAFEGNGLSCGCSAIPGAITHVILKNLRSSLTTIDNKLPVGICGSGAISLAAQLLENDLLSPEGVLSDQFPSDGITLCLRTDGTKISFTADDLRNVQLSIAAIAAGIETLTHAAGISVQEIACVYLGGGFGFSLDLSECQRLHMFSSINLNTIHPAGNTCLRGLYQFAMNSNLHNMYSNIANTCDSISVPEIFPVNLAESNYFKTQFISHMTYS